MRKLTVPAWTVQLGLFACFSVIAASILLAQQPVSITGQPVGVTATQGSATTAGNRWPVYLTDGTNTMPMGDASARTIHVSVDTAAALTTNLTQWNGTAVSSPDANGYTITPAAATRTASAAASACNILSTASNNATSCTATASNFYGYEVYNTTTTIYYLKLYNLATAPTCSVATGFIRSIPIPPASAAGGAGGAISNQGVPVNYSTGIGYCITAGSTGTDNSSAAAGIFGEIRSK